MAELTKFEITKLPKLCVVGKEIRYSWEALEDGDNRLPGFWNQCINENIFAPLEAQTEHVFDNAHVGVFLDWYLGDHDFTYIVGMLMKPGMTVPKGYVARELAETDVAVGWNKGKFPGRGAQDSNHQLMAQALKENGRTNANMKWCMELYNCSRATVPDEKGATVVDLYVPLD